MRNVLPNGEKKVWGIINDTEHATDMGLAALGKQTAKTKRSFAHYDLIANKNDPASW